jgi:hypothetical protein
MSTKLQSKWRVNSTRSVIAGQSIQDNYGISRLSVDFGLHNLAATVKAGRADVVTQVRFASGGLHSGTRNVERIMRAMHAAFGRRLFVLLNGHEILLNSLD